MAQKVEVEVNLIDNLTKNMAGVQRQLASHFAAMEKAAESAAQKTSKSMGDMKAPITAIRGVFLGMTAIVGGSLVKSFIAAGSEAEDLTVQFKVLLGSVEEAKKRIKEYSDFGAKTPFELGEIARAGRILQVFGGDVLATGKNLQMIGDIAAGVGQPFQDVAMWTGRMYDALQSGRPWGEAGARLQEMGALSGQARAELEAMQKSGASGAEIWSTFGKEMGRFNGMMDDLSKTVTGQISTSVDLLKSAARDILASGAWESLSKTVGEFNKTLQGLIDSGALVNFGDNLGTIAVIVRDIGVIWAGAKIVAGFEAMGSAMAVATGGATGLKAALGPLALGLGALQIALDAFLAAKEKELDKRADPNRWLGDPDKIKQVIGALKEWQAQTEKGQAVGFEGKDARFNAAKVSVEINKITGLTAEMLDKQWSLEQLHAARTNALRRTGIQGPATVDLGGPDKVTAPALGLSEKDVNKNREFVTSILDSMEAGRMRSVGIVAAADAEIKKIEEQSQEDKEKSAAEKIKRSIENQQIELQLAMGAASGNPIKQLETQQEEELRIFKGTASQKEQLEAQHETRMRALKLQTMSRGVSDIAANLQTVAQQYKSFAGVYKAVAHGKNMIDTYQSATASYASFAGLGPWGVAAGVVAAAAAVAAGLANASQINSQKFEAGGPVFGMRHSMGGVPAELEGGENIWSRRDVQNFGGQGGVESLKRGGGRSVSVSQSINPVFSVTIQGNANQETVRQLEDLSRSHTERVATAVAEAIDQRNPDIMRAFANAKGF